MRTQMPVEHSQDNEDSEDSEYAGLEDGDVFQKYRDGLDLIAEALDELEARARFREISLSHTGTFA